MLTRKRSFGAAGAAAFIAASLVGATLAGAPPAEAQYCAERHVTGYASLPVPLRATTGVAARAQWRKKVAERLGARYAYWSRARNRETRCWRRTRDAVGWNCSARAIPCTR
jgi:hypothetical protein